MCIKDPTNLEKFNMSAFHHLKHNLAANEEGGWVYLYVCVCCFCCKFVWLRYVFMHGIGSVVVEINLL